MSGKAVYYYEEVDGTRIYNGQFHYSKKIYDAVRGVFKVSAAGCFKNGVKDGHWVYRMKSKDVEKKLSMEYADGVPTGLYTYTFANGRGLLLHKKKTATLRLQLSDGKPQGEVVYSYGKRKLTGAYDEEGKAHGKWKLAVNMPRKKTTTHEIWYHGVCEKYYVVNEATGDKSKALNKLPNIIAGVVHSDCLQLEMTLKRGSKQFRI